MARRRNTAKTATRVKARSSTKAGAKTATTPSSGAATFTCPECGRIFGRAAALGAHRRRAHGVAGSSAQSQRGRTRRASAAPVARQVSSNGVDRDLLLRTLFPSGVPAQESVIRAVNNWLDEGERLANSR
jgi:hypothetical protein